MFGREAFGGEAFVEGRPLEGKHLEERPLVGRLLQERPLEARSLEGRPLEERLLIIFSSFLSAYIASPTVA